MIATATTGIAAELSDEFRLLTTEIMEAEGLTWPQAVERARAEWPAVGLADPDEPAGEPAGDPAVGWRFIAWVLLLLFTISVSVNLGFVWVFLTYGGQ